MEQTFLQLLPFLVAGAFLPTWTSYVILQLGTERPIMNSGGYVLGNATWRLLLGIVAIFIAQTAAPKLNTSKGIEMPVWFAATIAAMLLGMGLFLIARKPRTETEEQDLPGWLKHLKRLPPWASFGWGVYNCAFPGAQWVYFLGGTALIATSGLPNSEQFTLLLIFIAGLEVMLVTPIVIYWRRREKSKATFDRIEVWLGKHGSTVLGGILSCIGLVFALIALNGGKVG